MLVKNEKWWDNLKNQCPKCKEYLALYLLKETWKYNYFKCKFCGFERKHEISFADYKHKNGKTYLKRNGWGNYKRVELVRGFKKGQEYLQIKEVDLNNIKLL